LDQRILAVDPGERRIGLALSDESATIANPLRVLKHVSMIVDAGTIAQIAVDEKAAMILVGCAYGLEGEETPASRHAARLANAIISQIDLPVILWDESGSTQTAREARLAVGARRSRRTGHLDELAAVVILQSYLDSDQKR
jgi:putative holliday junction resolvase